MNERIRQLLEQAESSRLEYNSATMMTERIQEFDKQKFGELIVRECMEVSLKYSHRDDDMGAIIAEQIKQHFGVESEPKPVGNTLTFMTRAIFNVVAKHQETNGGYFIADGDVDDFVGRLAKVINSTFEPLKPRG